MDEHWLVVGASSAMARAFVREVAVRGAYVTVAGRDEEDLLAIAADAKLRGARDSRVLLCDVADLDALPAFAGNATMPGTELNVMMAVGSMPDQSQMQDSPKLLSQMMASTLIGPAALIESLAPEFIRQGSGRIILVGSVAGDRGRLKNHLYGAAKAGLATYAEGLRARFFHARTGVTVTLVKPGFIDTSMTWGLPGLFLVASPEDCARAMMLASRKGTPVLYFPGFWRWIMLIIRHIPAGIMKRLAF